GPQRDAEPGQPDRQRRDGQPGQGGGGQPPADRGDPPPPGQGPAEPTFAGPAGAGPGAPPPPRSLVAGAGPAAGAASFQVGCPVPHGPLPPPGRPRSDAREPVPGAGEEGAPRGRIEKGWCLGP